MDNKSMKRKTILVCGGGGFIGSHLVKRLKNEGHWVRVCDLKYTEYDESPADDFVVGDLRSQKVCDDLFEIYPDGVKRNKLSEKSLGHGKFDQTDTGELIYDEIYQLAADMGGAGFVFTGENDADIMHNSALINLNIVERAVKHKTRKLFYSSSACMYPEHNQLDPDNPKCTEDSAYPANPDSEYGWEKLFSERVFLAFARNKGLNVRVARFHNIFGIEGTWDGGREKAPAAMCRKAAMAEDGTDIEVWGDGKQTRSFLYIDECVEAVLRLMESDFCEPVNIGSEEMIAINDFAQMAIDISGKTLTIKNIEGPEGVRGRNSDNTLFQEKMGWSPSQSLLEGMEKTYKWIAEQVEKRNNKHIDYVYDDGVISHTTIQ
jgi:GDP-D-mannose 3',5'-epimerase